MPQQCHIFAAFWLFRGKNKEAGSLLSRAGKCKQDYTSVMLSFYKDWPAHQNRKENINKNVSLNHSHPRQRCQNLIGAEQALQNVCFMKLVKLYVC